jgi:hypothetical protein
MLTLPLLAATVLGGGAWAETNPYYIGLSQTFSHDSNMLRLANGQDALPGYVRADTVSTTALLAGFDQPFGRQRGRVSLVLREDRYSNNPTFDNTGYTASAGMDWSTVERVSGTLAASANRSLQRFNTEEIGFLTQKNLESSSNLNGSVSIGLVTQYSLELTAGHRQVSNSLDQPAVQRALGGAAQRAAGLRPRQRAQARQRPTHL